MEPSLIYCSYLLRLWQVREETGLAWRATLQEVTSGKEFGFADLEAMLAFLRSKTERGMSEEEDKAKVTLRDGLSRPNKKKTAKAATTNIEPFLPIEEEP